MPRIVASHRHMACCIPLVLAPCLGVPVGRAPAQPPDSVVAVTLTRTMRVPARRVSALVSIDGRAESAVAALTRSREAVAALVAVLRENRQLQIGEPEAVSLENQAARVYSPGQLPPSFVARHSVRVGGVAPDDLLRALATAFDAGARDFSSITFDSDVVDSARVVLLEKTVADGRREAEVLARALGGRLGALIGTNSTGMSPGAGVAAPVAHYGQWGGTLPPSELQLMATVSLRFRLVR